jgi:hypothetical protein
MMPRPSADRSAYYVGYITAISDHRASGERPQAESLAAAERLLERATEELGPHDAATLRIQLVIEEARAHTRPSRESVAAFQQLAVLCQAHLLASDAVALSTRSNLAQHLRKAGDIDLGIKKYREELDLRKEMFGEHAHRTCVSRQNLAVALRQKGTAAALSEARELTRSEIATRDRIWGPDHSFTWVAIINLANQLLDVAEGRWGKKPQSRDAAREALTLASDVYERRQKRFGPKHPSTLRAGRSKARAFTALGEHERASWILWRTLAVERSVGSDEPGETELFLAMALSAQDDGARVRSLIAEALPLLENHDEGHWRTRQAEDILARLRQNSPS